MNMIHSKFQFIVDHINNKFKFYYLLNQHLSIDKSLMIQSLTDINKKYHR